MGRTQVMPSKEHKPQAFPLCRTVRGRSHVLSLLALLLLLVVVAHSEDPDAWRSVAAARRVIDEHFDADCALRGDAVPMSLRVTAPAKKLDSSDSDVISAALGNSSMLVCRHVAVNQPPAPTYGRVAIVTSGDRFSYLTSTKPLSGTTMSIASVLQGKIEYTALKRLPFFVILGRLDMLMPGGFRSPTCTSRGLSTKYNGLKGVGLLALFLFEPNLRGAVYLDVDAAIIDFSVVPADFLRLSPVADLVATTNWRSPNFLNAGVVIFRNTPRSHTLLARWWHYRCGKHDQPGLWRALFEQWPGWQTDDEKVQEFWSHRIPLALPYVAHHHVRIRTQARLRTPWVCNGSCAWLYRETGCLQRPLEMPGLLLLPPLPLSPAHVPASAAANGSVPALQHYAGLMYDDTPKQWICHIDNQAGKTCSPRTEILSKGEDHLHRERDYNRCEHCKVAVRTLQESGCLKKGTSIYFCACEDMLLPEYTMSPNGSSVAALCRGCTSAKSRHFVINAHTQKKGGHVAISPKKFKDNHKRRGGSANATDGKKMASDGKATAADGKSARAHALNGGRRNTSRAISPFRTSSSRANQHELAEVTRASSSSHNQHLLSAKRVSHVQSARAQTLRARTAGHSGAAATVELERRTPLPQRPDAVTRAAGTAGARNGVRSG